MTSWRRLTAVAGIALLSACAQSPPHAAASNPPTAAAAQPVWYHVMFATNSYAIDAAGQKVVSDLTNFMQHDANAVATIIGKTDSVGSDAYNMHLSHRRADAVRDALVYSGKVPAVRVETRWTGDEKQNVASADGVAEPQNRVVDIAIH